MTKYFQKPKVLLVFIILIGFFFRFYKLNWGEGYFFHPDEYHIAAAVERLSFPKKMNPHFFSYGSFTIYLIYFSRFILSEISIQFSTLHPILIGRYFSALFSLLTILVIYKISSLLFVQKYYALLSSFLVAITPGIVQQAHFATPESILTFWLLLTLLFYLKYIEKKKLNTLLLSAITLGLAMATKIVALTFIPLLFVVLFITKSNKRKNNFNNIFQLILSLLTIASVFFISFPYSFLDKDNFLYSTNYEVGIGKGNPLVFYTRQFINSIPLIFQLTKIFPYVFSLSLFILGGIGLIWLVINVGKNILLKGLKKEKTFLVFLLAFCLYFFPNAFIFTKWTRFIAPIFPFWSIFFVYLLIQLKIYYKEKPFLKNCLIKGSVLFVVITTFFWLLMFFSIYINRDSRITATNWVNENIPRNSLILTETGNTLEVPLIGNYKKIVFDFYKLEENISLQRQLPELLFETDYFIVQSRRLFINHQRLPDTYPHIARFYDLLFSNNLGFEKVKEINSFPRIKLAAIEFIIDDEKAEETWSVFDHPVIRIYEKEIQYTSNEYKNILGF